MTFFIISAYINAITSTACCIFVLSSNLQSKINKSFAYFAFSIALWAAMRPIWMLGSNNTEVLFCMRISMISATFIPATLFHFTIHIINEYKKYQKFLYCLYTICLLISFTGFSPLFITNADQHLVFKHYPSAGPTFILMTIEFQFAVSYSLFLIYQKLRRISGYKRQQLKHVYYGILITYLGGVTNFPLVYHLPILPIGDIFVCAYTLFITYAIYRYQLMDIHIILKRSLVYTILITIITLIYLIFIYFTEHIVQSVIGYKSLLASTTFAAIIALIFIPLKNTIQNFVEKIMFRGSYVQIAEENELLRQEIIQTEKLKAVAVLASGMAHEIKNPLTPIKTFSEQLPSRLDDKEFLLKFSKIINKEVDRIDSLVQELLSFAKPSPPQLKKVNINHLIEQILELLNNEIIRHKITLNTSLENNNVVINIDPKQIKQAFLNIFLNAIDAMPEGGVLTIDSHIHGNDILIIISDTGCGISPNNLPHIFEPFFTKKDKGTGLGLAITQGIIEKHGGSIEVKSKLELGTTFTIRL